MPPVLHPLRDALRLRADKDLWHHRAVSVVVAVGIVEGVLLALGRLDLVLYAAGGGLCALYAHGLPYAARARTLALVVLGMAAGGAVAMTTAALTDATAVRVAVAAALAAAHKVVCDATRVGPPGNVIFTFVAASAAFAPQTPAQVPEHVGLMVLGGAVAWLVGMAPALVRPYGPERAAVARALEARAHVLAGDGSPARARHAATAAGNAAWHTLRAAGASAHRARLERLLARAGAAGPDGTPRLTAWARELRTTRTLPDPGAAGGTDVPVRPAPAHGPTARHLLPIGLRVGLGSAVAGWASMALGVDRPYWAVVTAAAVLAANTTLSWQRALQRVVGNLLGVLLFTLLVPFTTTGAVALIATALACNVAAEATIARNYWLASAFVTPMAMVMTEFAGARPAGPLVTDRWVDTLVGAVAGLAVCFAVPNRHAGRRVGAALDRLEGELAARLPREPRLTAALLELREAVDTASGEWWSGPLPEERITDAERRGHLALAGCRGAGRSVTPA
ncbi:FUSC family protein [Streptomyces sp. MI02-7b]|uniref:FUSC family protein n=1 Tax=Streptomyces sp. MI02-7b TaxID=462941 RepID=UPI0029B119DC|nr:FUSC family protein [Streptomyces sp. MI02-7b]MDX3071421.1 FUSC family protein [Streptomyces sp. MI02-7b]